MIPFFLGPIDISSPFMMVSVINDVPYVLVSVFIELLNETVYGLENNLDPLFDANNTIKKLAVFNVTGSLNSIIFKDSIIEGGIGTDSTGQLINVKTPETLVMSQTDFANWNPPTIFLASANYTLTKSNGDFIRIGDNKNLVFNILPLIWYFPCSQYSSRCCNLNNPESVLSNWFCIYDSTKDWCQNVDDSPQSFPVTKNGWTNISDCTIGQFYHYCPPGKYCGNDNCNGPCQNQTNNCNFKSDEYVCQIDLNKVASNTKWWESPVFFGSVIGLSVLIIFFIILIFIVDRHGKKIKDPTNISSPIDQID